jgi:CRISPR-associated protein Csh1
MIHAIKELGEYQTSVTGQDNLSIMLQDSYDGGKYPNCLLIQFEKDEEEEWKYKEIDSVENGTSLVKKLLYRRGSPRGVDLTPTTKLTELEKTLPIKIINWFKKARKNKLFKETEQELFEALFKELEDKYETIHADLDEKLKLLEGGSVISVTFIEEGEQKFIGDFPLFLKFFKQKSSAGYKSKYKKISAAENKACSVCGTEADEVFGFFTSLPFYTADKPGMIPGGFNQTDAWKNFPVCLDCALNIESGYELLQSNMDFRFYGLRYYLIPHFASKENIDEVIEIFTDDFLKKQRVSSDKREESRITNDENEVLEELAEFKNNMSLNLFFYDKPQKSVLRILLLIEDIFPSRISTLFKIKNIIDDIFCFRLPEKKGKRRFNFNFGSLRTFFPDHKTKYFLELVEKIFVGRPIKYSFMLNHIIEVIRSHFANGEDGFLYYDLIRAFMVLNFINELGILQITRQGVATPCYRNSKEVKKLNREFLKDFSIDSKEEFEEKIEGFFHAFPAFFQKDAHKFIFLNGVLTQFLLNIQKRDRGNDPFRKQLKGLKMLAKDLSGLLPQIQEKLEQYDKNYYRPLEKLIAEYAVSAGNPKNWKLSVDEINFIFAVGMNLSQYFKIKKEEEHNDNQ